MGFGCIICSEEFSSHNSEDKDKQPVSIKNCGHVFHDSCLNMWLQKNASCPMCREISLPNKQYVSRLHFQRLSLDTSVVNNLLDETAKLRDELKQKEEEIKMRDLKVKEIAHELKKVKEAINKYHEGALKSLSNIMNKITAPVDQNNNAIPALIATSSAPAVSRISSKIIQSRPTTGSMVCGPSSRPTASSVASRHLSSRGRSASSNVLPTRR